MVCPTVSTLWEPPFATCSSCTTDGSPVWNCPAAVSTYADLGGPDANIIELDFGAGKRENTRRNATTVERFTMFRYDAPPGGSILLVTHAPVEVHHFVSEVSPLRGSIPAVVKNGFWRKNPRA